MCRIYQKINLKMNGVGNVGYKKFCLWPLRCRGHWPPALPGCPSGKRARPAASEPGGHAAGGQRPASRAAMRPAASEPGGRPVWPSAIGHAPLIL